MLFGKKVYLSGPIENDCGVHNWRTHIKDILTTRYNIEVFDPFADPKQQFAVDLAEAKLSGDYDRVAEIAARFVKKDLSVVDRSDIVIAFLPKNVYTCGTHHEIIHADNLKKIVLLVCPQGKQHIPGWYYGFIPHSQFFSNFDELFQYLDKAESGEFRGQKRWLYLYGEI